jgi:uncharacterized protein YqgC (DUF456 family)
MLIGLCATVVPRLPGTLIILAGIALYGAFTGFQSFTPPLWTTLLILALVAEVGGRFLRYYLTKRYAISRLFATNSTLANTGGILAADAMLGPIFGLIAWELIAGKTLQPRWNTVGKILMRLAAAAVLRLVCGLVMIVLAYIYII